MVTFYHPAKVHFRPRQAYYYIAWSAPSLVLAHPGQPLSPPHNACPAYLHPQRASSSAPRRPDPPRPGRCAPHRRHRSPTPWCTICPHTFFHFCLAYISTWRLSLQSFTWPGLGCAYIGSVLQFIPGSRSDGLERARFRRGVALVDCSTFAAFVCLLFLSTKSYIGHLI